MSTYKVKLVARKDTETNWQTLNPILLNGELGIATHVVNGIIKFKGIKSGDGVAWNDTEYLPIINTYGTADAISDVMNSIEDSDSIQLSYNAVTDKYFFEFIGADIDSTDDIINEGTNKWWTNTRTISSVLTGYIKAASQSAIVVTDTILSALGKLEKKVDDTITTVSNLRNQAQWNFFEYDMSGYSTHLSLRGTKTFSLPNNRNLSAYYFVVSLDGVTWTNQADLSALQIWVNTNITGNNTTGTQFYVYPVCTARTNSSIPASIVLSW